MNSRQLSATVCVASNVLFATQDCSASVDIKCPRDYVAMVTGQRAQIQSLSGKIKCQLKWDPEVERRGLLVGRVIEEEYSFAIAGEKRFRSLKDVTFLGKSRSRSEYTSVFNGADNRQRMGKEYRITAAKSAHSDLNAYLGALKWPITEQQLAQCRNKKGDAPFLPYLLESEGWRLLPEERKQNGLTCKVFDKDSGRIQLWFAPSKDNALVKLVHINPVAEIAKWENEYSEFFELIPHFYMPKRIEASQDLADEKGQFVGRITNIISVLSLSASPVPDSQFELKPLPGEQVFDEPGRTVYRFMPVSESTLDNSLARVKSAQVLSSRNEVVAFILPILGAALLGAAVIICMKWWRRRAS